MEKAVEKKAPAKKTPAAPKKTVKKAAPAKASGKGLVVVQMRSSHGAKPGVAETLKGLGLGRPRARKELLDTPAVRGMLFKVRHIVKVEGE